MLILKNIVSYCKNFLSQIKKENNKCFAYFKNSFSYYKYIFTQIMNKNQKCFAHFRNIILILSTFLLKLGIRIRNIMLILRMLFL